MKFSMMTYTMMRQKCYTPEDCVRVAKELNMDGIDWVTTYDRDARELKKLSDDAGLPVVAHTFFLRKDDMPQLESVAARHLDDAVTLGAPVVMISPSPHPASPRSKSAASCGSASSKKSRRSPPSAI